MKKITPNQKLKYKPNKLVEAPITIKAETKLTNRVNSPFIIAFKGSLESDFRFQNIEQRELKALDGFIEKVSKMTFYEVDKQFLRPKDDNDDCLHYKVSKKFRIFGYIDNGLFVVKRIDSNHKFHD